MIQAVFLRREGKYAGVRITGHSGYAEEGSDIVCAAASSLAVTCVNSLESLLDVRVQVRGGVSGLLSFDLPEVPAEKEAGVQLLLGAMKQGFSDLQDAWPAYVKLEIKERR